MFVPSAYQEAIFEWVRAGEGNAFVDAAAGSGKSTTLVQAAALLPKKTKALFCAFNRHIAKELDEKLKTAGAKMECRTLHGLGRGALVRGLKSGEYAQELSDPIRRKYADLAKRFVQETIEPVYTQRRIDWEREHPLRFEVMGDEDEIEELPLFDLYQLAGYLRKLVDFARQTRTDPEEGALRELNSHYDLGVDFETVLGEEIFWPLLAQGVPQVIADGAQEYVRLGKIDYTDMIFLPIYLNLPPAQYDWLMIDEAQDLNACQLELILRARRAGARLLFCGDPKQSLYGFTGADTRSVETIVSRCSATVLPLSICYRCPTSHIGLARQVCAQIEPSPSAPLGVVDILTGSEADRLAQPKDYFICRTNAPLVSRWMALVRQGQKAVVLGKDLGKNFTDLLERLNKRNDFSWSELLEVVDSYQREQERILSKQKENEMALEALRDQVETLKALHRAYLSSLGPRCESSLKGFVAYIDAFFAPEEDEDGKRISYDNFVTCCTIHKAKGLEARRIFVERPDLLPHPAAKSGWQQEQEQNILYVALTRAKEELYFIDQAPQSLELQLEDRPPVVIEVEAPEEEWPEPEGDAFSWIGQEDLAHQGAQALFRDTLQRPSAQPVTEETKEESSPAPLTEGRIARIAAIEILCPKCAGLCLDGHGSSWITADLVGHVVSCSRCSVQCIVPLNAFSLEGHVVAREKPVQKVDNREVEKKGRTQKEKKSNAGPKLKGKERRQPLQLSLDMRVIRALKTWKVNASELFFDLLCQYDEFRQWYASANEGAQPEDEEEEEETE